MQLAKAARVRLSRCAQLRPHDEVEFLKLVSQLRHEPQLHVQILRQLPRSLQAELTVQTLEYVGVAKVYHSRQLALWRHAHDLATHSVDIPGAPGGQLSRTNADAVQRATIPSNAASAVVVHASNAPISPTM